MTVITEYRLKCDYCGNVSPTLPRPHEPIVIKDLPFGWLCRVSSSEHDGVWDYDSITHFCTPAHKEAWEKQQAAGDPRYVDDDGNMHVELP